MQREAEARRREAAIAAELARPWSDRAELARSELAAAADDNRTERLCYAAWVVSRMPDGDKQAHALDRLRKAAERKEITRLRRDAMRYRSVMCRDGEESPTCVCGESLQGCCSHHGGVASCARIEEPTITCPNLNDREWVEKRMRASIGR